jgi:hypothetical protein
MNDCVELIGLLENPPARRVWLLANALRCLPFDRAIELASAAEVFVTGASIHNQADAPRVHSEPDLESTSSTTESPSAGTPPLVERMVHQRSPNPVRGADRDRLLGRLAEGAKNAELAAEFGLSSKQVQGVRMGCAREIAKRREQPSGGTVPADQIVTPTAWIEDVVRYLRQQDDVVVRQENGEFLVNGRFSMPSAELLARANRMRAREDKPAFESPGDRPPQREEVSPVNGHPLFWKEPAERNGFDKPVSCG